MENARMIYTVKRMEYLRMACEAWTHMSMTYTTVFFHLRDFYDGTKRTLIYWQTPCFFNNGNRQIGCIN